MGIAAINPYSNPFVNGSYDQLQQTERAATKTKTAAEKSNTASAVQLQSPDKVITSKERDFFIKMFPENSEQLSKHVLFNKNGKLQSYGYSKGMIIDGRA